MIRKITLIILILLITPLLLSFARKESMISSNTAKNELYSSALDFLYVVLKPQYTKMMTEYTVDSFSEVYPDYVYELDEFIYSMIKKRIKGEEVPHNISEINLDQYYRTLLIKWDESKSHKEIDKYINLLKERSDVYNATSDYYQMFQVSPPLGTNYVYCKVTDLKSNYFYNNQTYLLTKIQVLCSFNESLSYAGRATPFFEEAKNEETPLQLLMPNEMSAIYEKNDTIILTILDDSFPWLKESLDQTFIMHSGCFIPVFSGYIFIDSNNILNNYIGNNHQMVDMMYGVHRSFFELYPRSVFDEENQNQQFIQIDNMNINLFSEFLSFIYDHGEIIKDKTTHDQWMEVYLLEKKEVYK